MKLPVTMRACPGCACHVRVAESTCPHCGAAVPLLPSVAQRATMNRAALLALGIATVVGCGEKYGGGDTGDEANPAGEQE